MPIYRSDIYPEDHYVVDAIRDFEDFASTIVTDHPSFSGRYEYLDGYLYDWLTEGSGVERSGGDPQTWFKIAFHVADAVFKDPTVIEYCPEYEGESGVVPSTIQRTIKGLFNPDGSGLEILDPGFYQVHKIRKLKAMSTSQSTE